MTRADGWCLLVGNRRSLWADVVRPRNDHCGCNKEGQASSDGSLEVRAPWMKQPCKLWLSVQHVLAVSDKDARTRADWMR